MRHRRQQHTSHPRRLQTSSKETDPPLGNNNGGRPYHYPQKSTLRRTQRTSLRPPRNN